MKAKLSPLPLLSLTSTQAALVQYASSRISLLTFTAGSAHHHAYDIRTILHLFLLRWVEVIVIVDAAS